MPFHLPDFITAQLHNQLVGGGLVLMITGSVMALCRKIPEELWAFTKRQLTVTVEILSADPLFDYTSLWLNAHNYSKVARFITATTMVPTDESNPENTSRPANNGSNGNRKSVLPNLIFTPSPGTHYLFYNGRPLRLVRHRTGGSSGNPDNNSGPSSDSKGGFYRLRESYTITGLGRSQKYIREMTEEILKAGVIEETGIRVYYNTYDYWKCIGKIHPRSLESVILPDGTLEGLIADLQKFLNSERQYRELGIPYHRGYLFFGNPGGGKTTTVAALAGALHMNLYIINLVGYGMSDDNLASLLSEIRPGSMIIMEDVDCTVPTRDKDKDSIKEERVTLSGLLNCLDGFMAREGCALFMTTNNRDALDPALIRSGRVDYQMEFKPAAQEQVVRMAKRLGRDCNPDDYVGLSMADVQQRLLQLPEGELCI